MGNTENTEMRDLMTISKCIATSVLHKWKLILCVALLFGMILDMIQTVNYRPQYLSSVQAVMRTGQNTYSDLQETRAYLKTMEYILNGQVAQNYVREQLNQPDMPMKCSVISEEESNVIQINMVSNSRQNSFYALKELMNWYAANSETFSDKHVLNVKQDVTFREQPLQAFSHGRNFVLGMIGGGAIMAVILVVLDALRKTIRIPKDVERLISCRLFAKIPRERKPRNGKFWKRNKTAILISSVKTSFPYCEAIKKLRHKLEASAQKHNYKTILITSTSENEGKSSISANLAIALAMKKHKVLLIDCDLLKPSMHKVFECSDQSKSLNQYLKGNAEWKSQIQTLPKQGIDLLISTPQSRTETLLNNGQLEKLLQQAKQEYDYVIIDSAPAGSLNDSIQLNRLVDASLLVVKQDTTGCGFINETVSRMTNAKNNLIGCIYNARLSDNTAHNRMYSYGYDQYYSYGRGR